MNDMLWEKVVTLLVTFTLLDAMMRWRARAGRDLGTLSRVLRYPAFLRVVAWVCLIGMGLLWVLSTGTGNQGIAAPPWLQGFFGVMTLGSVALVLEFSVRTVRRNEHAIFSTSPWSRKKELPWDDVTRVTYSEANRWFVFSSSSGSSITVHSMLAGVAGLLQHARSILPERAYREALAGFRAHGGLEERRLRFRDYDGRDVEVPVSAVRGLLPQQLEAAWTDADALCSVIQMGIDAGYTLELVPAAARLVVLEGESERSLLVSASVWMKNGDLAAAERQLEASVRKHGRTGRSLTCEARLLAERGDRERSLATLREGLQLDPNQEPALAWWLGLARERRGQAGYVAALEEAAASEGAFRAQLILAHHHLESGRRAEAIALYERVLSVVPREPSVLLTISAALGNAGALADMVRLVAPHYSPDHHGRYTGLNLALALEKLGRAAEADAVRDRLEGGGTSFDER